MSEQDELVARQESNSAVEDRHAQAEAVTAAPDISIAVRVELEFPKALASTSPAVARQEINRHLTWSAIKAAWYRFDV